MSLNMLMNVAKYLNEGWHPDLRHSDYIQRNRYFICEDINSDKLRVYCEDDVQQRGVVYFKTMEKAEMAIKILGEEVVKLALSLKY